MIYNYIRFTFIFYVRQNINDDPIPRPIIHQWQSNPGEDIDAFLRRRATEMTIINNEIGELQIDKAEYERLPDKQTESLITDDVLNDVLKAVEKYLKEDSILCNFGMPGNYASFIAAFFKNAQMKTSSLPSAMVEAH